MENRVKWKCTSDGGCRDETGAWEEGGPAAGRVERERIGKRGEARGHERGRRESCIAVSDPG